MTVHAAALAAAIGAWWPAAVPFGLTLSCAALAVMLWPRTRAVAVVLVALVTSSLGNHALAALDPPAAAPVAGWVTLLDDPRPFGSRGVRATVGWEGRRVDLTAYGAVAGRVDDVLAGERLRVTGSVVPVDDEWSRWRHVVGRIVVHEVVDRAPAAPLPRAANWLRRCLARGALSLGRDSRALFAGMVVGDDRDQSVRLSDDFRAAGLGHLLVVSGQNVAFVLSLGAPLLARLRPGGRLVASALLLGCFALLTRFEPSVLRAVTMAGLAVAAGVFGYPEHARRVLSASVAVLLVVDPFLVHVVAFQLSVAATAGIVWLGQPLAGAIPGPRPFALAAATTISAQLAVLPVLIAVFGPVPLAALPANLLAAPAAGPVMMWGCTGGLVAGLFGGTFARVLHLPTAALLWWVSLVAEVAAQSRPAVLGVEDAVVIALAVLAVLARPCAASRRAAFVAGAAVALVAWSGAPSPAAGWSDVDGARVWSDGESVVVVLDAPWSPRRLLQSLRESGVGRPNLVVAASGGRADADAVVALVDRFGALAVLAPPMHRVPGGRTATTDQQITIGNAVVEVVSASPLRVRVVPS